MAKRRYPLSIHITSLFLVLSIILGGALIAISYQHSQILIEHSAKKISIKNSHKLESIIQKSVSPILTTLDLMASTSLSSQPPQSGKLSVWTNSIQLIFDRNPHLTGLFYASTDGSFTQFRPMTDKIAKAFKGPQESKLMINYYKMGEQNIFHFLGDDIHLIEKKTDTIDNQDPRKRPWYVNATPDGKIGLSEPYRFYFLNETGITLSRMSLDGDSVVAADFTLNSLSNQLDELATSDQTKLAVFDINFNLLAQHNLIEPNKDDQAIDDINLSKTVFKELIENRTNTGIFQNTQFNEKQWQVSINIVRLTDKVQILLAEATPREELLVDLVNMRNQQIFAAILTVILSFALVWYAALKVTRPLDILAELTKDVRSFNFRKTRYPRSVIKEVNNLTDSVQMMEHTLFDLLKLLRETAKEHDFNVLAKTICKQAYIITKAETIVLYMKEENEKLFSIVTNHSIIPLKLDLDVLLSNTPWMLSRLSLGEDIVLTKQDNCLKPYLDQFYNSELHLFPLQNREKQLMGILILGYERNDDNDRNDKHGYLKELLSFAEIAKDNIAQMQQRKAMLNSFIELIASAIDTKSPYTGGHCQRVPVITELLVKAANEDKRYFPEFSMDPKKWEELNFAAWLHDCGKVTTPEYIVDKATKLETIYDRIHEVRMRFELLKSKAKVDYYKELAEGGDPSLLKSRLGNMQQQLDDDFAFIAECNLGHSEMSEDDYLRLKEIASKTWTKTIDDQQGVSWIEREKNQKQEVLPAEEPLLSDKDIHKVPWEEEFNPKELWQDEFNLKPSDLKYNRGELHNLNVKRGTLTDEERFIINDHIIQTITMLKRLPYPDHLKNVPDIAGNHHERMDGKGYPRGLKADQLSIQSRAMAIADIFEALTSSDRPYKKTHTIDEAFGIMTHLATSGHIDPKLYLLFLNKTIDKVYGDSFLNKEQHFNIEREAHIKKVKAYIQDDY